MQDADQEFMRILQLLKAKFGWAVPAGSQRLRYIETVCPKCGRRKLSVDACRGTYKCWRECGGGKLSDLLAGVSFDLVKGGPAFDSQAEMIPQRLVYPGVVESLASLADDHPAITYIKNRGFDPYELEQVYKVGYCGQGEVFARGRYCTSNTLMFPMYLEGKLVAWQSRLLYDPDKLTESECYDNGMTDDPEDGRLMRFPKYFTMPGFRKGSMFFNFDNAKHSEVVVVTEGTFDSMSVGRCGVAALGKGVSNTQVSILAGNWRLAILLLDPDAVKENAELEARLALKGMPSIKVTLAGDHDAGEFTQEGVWEQIDAACMAQGVDLTKYRIEV